MRHHSASAGPKDACLTIGSVETADGTSWLNGQLDESYSGSGSESKWPNGQRNAERAELLRSIDNMRVEQ